MKALEWLSNQLGFAKISKYQQRYINDSNIHTSLYMSFIVVVLEIWMIIRYVQQRPGLTFIDYFDGETNYLILLSSALLLLSFSVRYVLEIEVFLTGRVISLSVILLDICMITRFIVVNKPEMNAGEICFGLRYMLFLMILALVYIEYDFSGVWRGVRDDMYGQIMNCIFSVIALGFGIETSLYDIGWNRQILCFVAMTFFATCMLVWRPYVSVIILSAVFFYFYSLWLPHLKELDLVSGKVLQGDTINFLVLWIVLVMISFTMYHQRLREAGNDENLISANNRLNRVAVEDDLTGIHNMIYFNQEAAYLLQDESADIDNKIFLFFNIENFKTYNDQFGYQAGNDYLKYIAGLVKEYFSDDITARLSDDHFVILTDIEGSQEKIGKLRDKIHEGVSEVYLELKVGAYRPIARGLDPRIAIDYARYACSLTKNKYGINYIEYDKTIDDTFHRRQYIVNNIDIAIANGYIEVYYQPVVWADSRHICGCEALARWNDPSYGFLSPGEFIPVLEEYRLIHKLDRCILEKVCADYKNSIKEGRRALPISINFSRLDFELIDVKCVLDEMTSMYEVPKDFVHVEITESALTDDDGVIDRTMHDLHDAGYSIWLDDFGSGYSSLNVLKDYHFDMMKIDMKFLDNFSVNKESHIILGTVIKLAEELNMMSLTEGVETDEVADFLTKSRCGRLQGYLFGKPMPKLELRKKIDAGEYVIAENLA